MKDQIIDALIRAMKRARLIGPSWAGRVHDLGPAITTKHEVADALLDANHIAMERGFDRPHLRHFDGSRFYLVFATQDDRFAYLRARVYQ
jgi:hypothetical protein